jgi:replication factor A1
MEKRRFYSNVPIYPNSYLVYIVGTFREKERILLQEPRAFSRHSDEKRLGTNLNNHKPILDEQLAFLSVKHGVYLAELYEAIVSARKTGESTCENLKIEYRGSVEGEAIFLITKENRVVVQFHAPEKLLLRKDISFESWMNTDKVRNQIARQNTSLNQNRLIQDLRHGMRKVNIEAQVVEVSKPQLLSTQYGNSATLTSIYVADETGKIKLCLWNEQAAPVKVGDTIHVKDGAVKTFRGERQLTIGRNGALSIISSCTAEVKNEREQNAKHAIYA